jgi:hypothetical protein
MSLGRRVWLSSVDDAEYSWVRVAMLTAFVVLMSMGCLNARLAPENLPEQPIAFLHWTGTAAKKRSSVMGNASEMPELPPGRFDPERDQENGIRAYLRAEKSLIVEQQLSEYPGRLSLFWPSTGEIERIEAAPLGSLPLAWSSDHRSLLFVSRHRREKEQLYEYHLDRRDLRPITRGPDEHPRGDYGPNGQVFVQRLKRVSSHGKSVMTVHRTGLGGGLGPVVGREIPPGTLRVTPDGSRLVYEQVILRPRRDGPMVLESMIATLLLEDGAEEKLFLKGREPTLTPDGQWIVFASASSAGYRLRRMRPDGSSRVPISPGGTEERMPSVSPDGELIVFVRTLNGKRALAVRRFDGKGERTLVSDGWSEFPVW